MAKSGNQSVEAVGRLDDSRVRCIALSERVGGAEARNIGIRDARSTWIALLDDDDEWLPRNSRCRRTQSGEPPDEADSCGDVSASPSRHGFRGRRAAAQTSAVR